MKKFSYFMALALTIVSGVVSAQTSSSPEVYCWSHSYRLDDSGDTVKTKISMKKSTSAPGAFDGHAVVQMDSQHAMRIRVRALPNRDGFTLYHHGAFTLNIQADAYKTQLPLRSLGYSEGTVLNPMQIGCSTEGMNVHPIMPDGCSVATIRNVDVQSALLAAPLDTSARDLFKAGRLPGETPFSFWTQCKAWR